MGTADPLLPGHHTDFFGLVIPEEHYPKGSTVTFDYQIDAQDCEKTRGQVSDIAS